MILRLRLLCNNGTRQVPDPRPEIEDYCTEDEIVDSGISACPVCSCEINVSDRQDEISPGASPQDSIQLLCPTCLSPSQVKNTENQAKLKKHRSAKVRLVQKTNTTSNSSPRSHSSDREPSALPPRSIFLNGHSSKMSVLISNIQEHISSSKRYVGFRNTPGEASH